jgi:hypothetical protein
MTPAEQAYETWATDPWITRKAFISGYEAGVRASVEVAKGIGNQTIAKAILELLESSCA